MDLKFFQALNPLSHSSGIISQPQIFIKKEWNKNYYQNIDNNVEYPDFLFTNAIESAFYTNLTLIEAIWNTYIILVGEHYPHLNNPSNKPVVGLKGALDFLIFPLLARKLISDTYLEERKETFIKNKIAWTFGLAMEAIRFGLGIALTMLLSPVVALVHFAKNCYLTDQDYHNHKVHIK